MAPRTSGSGLLSQFCLCVSIPPSPLGLHLSLLAIVQCAAHVTRYGITARVALRLVRHGAPLKQPVRFLTGRQLDVIMLVAQAARRRRENRREGLRGDVCLRWHCQHFKLIWIWWRLCMMFALALSGRIIADVVVGLPRCHRHTTTWMIIPMFLVLTCSLCRLVPCLTLQKELRRDWSSFPSWLNRLAVYSPQGFLQSAWRFPGKINGHWDTPHRRD